MFPTCHGRAGGASIVLVLLGYGLLAAALVANLRNKIAWQRHSPARRVPADG